MKTKERIKKTGEVFTPPELVNEILDKLPNDVWQSGKTFCDPTAGNGNFLIEILKRKLSFNHDHLCSLETIYGVELMEDNVIECRKRLLELIPEKLHEKAKEILSKNIVCHDALTWNFEKWQSNVVKSKKLFL